jgi:hypothetical protein
LATELQGYLHPFLSVDDLVAQWMCEIKVLEVQGQVVYFSP